MERWTIEQWVKDIGAYYEKGRSNQNAYHQNHLQWGDTFVNKQTYRIWANDNPRVIVEKPIQPKE